MFSARNFNTTQPGADCYTAKSLYSKLLWLWYLLSLKAVIFCLLAFGFGGGPHSIVNNNAGADNMKTVLVPVAVDAAILWLCTLIFLDYDIQRAWKRRKFGRILSHAPFRVIGWILCIGVPLTVSLLFVFVFNFGFGGLMAPANVFRWWAYS